MTDPRFLLDTNILIYLLSGDASPLRRRVEMPSPGEAVTSSICAAEVAVALRDAGAEVGGVMDRIYRLIEPLPFERGAAERFGELPYRRGRSDRPTAAHALSAGLTLVTKNERDVADVAGLVIENWTR